MNVQSIRNRPQRPTAARMRGGQRLAIHDWLVAADAMAMLPSDDGHGGLLPYAPAGWGRRGSRLRTPLVTQGLMVEPERQPPHGQPVSVKPLVLTTDPDLRLMIDGRIAEPWWKDDKCYIFKFAERPGVVRIISRSVRPTDLGHVHDSRELGVSIKRIVARQPRRLCVIMANDPGLSEGFHGYEPSGDIRWTNGDGVLPTSLFTGFTGRIELELQLGPATRYPVVR